MKLLTPFQFSVNAHIPGILGRTAKTSGKVFGILAKTAEQEPSTLDSLRSCRPPMNTFGDYLRSVSVWPLIVAVYTLSP